MKAADLPAARHIMDALANLAAQEAAIDAGIASAGIRSENTKWIDFPVQLYEPVKELMRKNIAARRAALHRSAAQINLIL